MNLADLRENYTQGGIRVAEMHPDPLIQLEEWFKVARDQGITDSNAMNLATANQEGIVSARTVLLKGIVKEKLQFFTNYESQKGRDLAENPNASMTFHWRELERQICIRGTVQKTSRATSEAYFRTRPYGSQVGAWVSEKQSARIDVRATLETRDAELKARFPESGEVPCPDFWGGYELTPTYIEFWQGRQGRLHDRLRYLSKDAKWTIDRLSP